MFKVEQRVWDVVRGEGVVYCIKRGHPYPVGVMFANGDESTYLMSGKFRATHENPSLYPYPVGVVKKITKPTIDWEHVRNKFKWIAQDAEGGCWLYEDKPVEGEGEWKCSSGDCTSAEGFISLIPGTCDWKDSLVVRPEGA